MTKCVAVVHAKTGLERFNVDCAAAIEADIAVKRRASETAARPDQGNAAADTNQGINRDVRRSWHCGNMHRYSSRRRAEAARGLTAAVHRAIRDENLILE